VNKEEKAAVIGEVAEQIKESEAILAVDYRGISVTQAAELRARLDDAGARFRVVKNRLTQRAADEAGAEDLKDFLEGPTAFTFVSGEGGDIALAAKALAQFRRETDLLEFKGGTMGGELLTVDQIQSIATLPALDALHAQFVGTIASPITGLVRGLNQLIAGLALQLGQIAEQGLIGADGAESPVPSPQSPEEPEAEAKAPEQTSEEAPSEGDGTEKEG
jgi:large subunit ribosomal protein L10